MKYIPCTLESAKASRFYCGYNADCFRTLKTQAKIREIYDTRDGSTCSTAAVSCPC